MWGTLIHLTTIGCTCLPVRGQWFAEISSLMSRRPCEFPLRRSSNYRPWRNYWFLRRRNLRLMWSNHMQRFQEWRHPLKKRYPEKEGSKPGKLIDYCMMLNRLWEHPHHIAARGGHWIDTLDTSL